MDHAEKPNILNMLLRPVDSQAFRSNFKLGRGIPEAQEGEDPHEDADGVSLEVFQGPDIHCLRTKHAVSGGTFHLRHATLHVDNHLLVPKPVAKINTLDHRGSPFVAVDEREGLEHVLDVAMAPVFAFDGGDRGDI